MESPCKKGIHSVFTKNILKMSFYMLILNFSNVVEWKRVRKWGCLRRVDPIHSAGEKRCRGGGGGARHVSVSPW